MGFQKEWLRDHYMFATSAVAFLTAGVNLFIIFWMSGHNPFAEMIINYVAKLFALDPELKLTALDPGLGLGAIGIMTFFGVSLSSSIFEEHRHDHGISYASNKIIVGKDVPKDTRENLRNVEAQEFSDKLDELLEKERTPSTGTLLLKEANVKKALKDDVLEKYKHKESNFVFVSKDNPKEDGSGHFIENVIVGTGIMRKSLAASIVITYIVLIGLSFSAGTLADPLAGNDSKEPTENSVTKQSILGAVSHFLVSGQIFEVAFGVEKSVELSEKIGLSETPSTQKNTASKTESEDPTKTVEQLLLEKNPRTLVEHFTIVVTAVIGFYFGSNTIKAVLKARKEDKSNDNLSDINKKFEKQDELVKAITEIKDKMKIP